METGKIVEEIQVIQVGHYSNENSNLLKKKSNFFVGHIPKCTEILLLSDLVVKKNKIK